MLSVPPFTKFAVPDEDGAPELPPPLLLLPPHAAATRASTPTTAMPRNTLFMRIPPSPRRARMFPLDPQPVQPMTYTPERTRGVASRVPSPIPPQSSRRDSGDVRARDRAASPVVQLGTLAFAREDAPLSAAGGPGPARPPPPPPRP